jgi:hypothetical protein
VPTVDEGVKLKGTRSWPPRVNSGKQSTQFERETGATDYLKTRQQMFYFRFYAYATGQTLWILKVTGFDTAEPAYQRALVS